MDLVIHVPSHPTCSISSTRARGGRARRRSSRRARPSTPPSSSGPAGRRRRSTPPAAARRRSPPPPRRPPAPWRRRAGRRARPRTSTPREALGGSGPRGTARSRSWPSMRKWAGTAGAAASSARAAGRAGPRRSRAEGRTWHASAKSVRSMLPLYAESRDGRIHRVERSGGWSVCLAS